MKVWIVSQCWDYEGCVIKEVFDTEEKAEEFYNTLSTNYMGVCEHGDIKEWEVK